VPVSPARKIAFDVLRQVASQGAYASELLFTKLGSKPGSKLGLRVSSADAGLATELTLGVLRWQGLLDFLLQRHLDRPAERLDLEVQLALRLGLYQLRFLERVPAHAAVNESVELTKLAKKRSAVGFVNAILRKVTPDAKLSNAEIAKLLAASATNAERLAILHSHPAWMVERWIAAFGAERALALLEANDRQARLSGALLSRDDVDAPEAMMASLQADGLATEPGRWLRSAFTIASGNPTLSKAFLAGALSFQDEASQMVAHLVDARPGQRVLDLCSAPGGKTLLLARAAMPGGQVIAADLHEHRLRSTRQQLTRTATQNVQLLALDATQPLPFTETFDRILLDAPCSGTGTLARNPEIRWRLQPGDLGHAHRQQVAMLGHALQMLAPGGRLVYATCSLEPEENEQVVQEALATQPNIGPNIRTNIRPGIRVVSGLAALEPHLRAGAAGAPLFDAQGFFRSFPPDTQTDGFFAAVLERAR
jgi:16S rRNA (cytosine967-C5)-methyltransferase